MATMTPEQEAIVDQLDHLVETRARINLLMNVNFVPNIGDNMLVDVKGTLSRYYTAGHYVVLMRDGDRIYFPVNAVDFILEGNGIQGIKLKDGWFDH